MSFPKKDWDSLTQQVARTAPPTPPSLLQKKKHSLVSTFSSGKAEKEIFNRGLVEKETTNLKVIFLCDFSGMKR